ncbi:hypothetical protein [Arcanobacterium canis]
MPALAATFRGHYGVSLWTVGTEQLPWCEALALVDAALDDPSTPLAAALVDDPQWYPFRPAELRLILMVRRAFGVESDDLLPVTQSAAGRDEPPSEDELAEALEILEQSISFS